jgi:superfamily II DNA or RNA helicase
LEKVLNGIIGDIVIEMDVKQGVSESFLSRPRFYVVKSSSSVNYESDDPAKMINVHFYRNSYVYEQAGKLASRLVKMGKRVLILIDEVTQFPRLLPHLQYKCGFAHGPLTEDNRRGVPTEYWKSDSMQLVNAFDNADFPILVGTSCIGTGTDIKSVSAILDLVGGRSEIRVRQAVGRGTRLYPGKEDCLYFDFDIENVPMLHKHSKYRVSIYEDIYGPIEYIG